MKKKINILLVIAWMIFIFVMSNFNATESSNQSNFIVNIISHLFNITNINLLTFIIRKLAHFTEYLILGILISNYLNSYHKKIYLSTIICFVYAISDEVHQIFVPGRSFQIRDIIIDTMGAIFGIIIYRICRQKIDKK